MKIALTPTQIAQYNPPPNPAKMSDPRAKDFVDLHGSQSWEVDALKPEVLNQILENAIAKTMNFDLYINILRQEKLDKEKIKSLKKHL